MTRLILSTLSIAGLLLATPQAPRTTTTEPRILHVVRCADDSPEGRCNVVSDRSFDASRMSAREVRRQTRVRLMAVDLEIQADRTLRALQDYQCGKIGLEEYRARHELVARPPVMDIPDGCDFGDPDCPNCWTFFDAPGGSYCTDACVNCKGAGGGGSGGARSRR